MTQNLRLNNDYVFTRDAEAVEKKNFCGSWKREKATASTLIFHIKYQNLECGAIFCKIYDKNF